MRLVAEKGLTRHWLQHLSRTSATWHATCRACRKANNQFSTQGSEPVPRPLERQVLPGCKQCRMAPQTAGRVLEPNYCSAIGGIHTWFAGRNGIPCSMLYEKPSSSSSDSASAITCSHPSPKPGNRLNIWPAFCPGNCRGRRTQKNQQTKKVTRKQASRPASQQASKHASSQAHNHTDKWTNEQQAKPRNHKRVNSNRFSEGLAHCAEQLRQAPTLHSHWDCLAWLTWCEPVSYFKSHLRVARCGRVARKKSAPRRLQTWDLET